MNTSIGSIAITYKNESGEFLELTGKKDLENKDKVSITIKTEAWTVDHDQIDELIKTLKKFKDQAVG